MKTLIVIACLVAVGLAVESVDRSLDEHWANFKRVHEKRYRLLGEEFNRRLIWQRNVKRINQHNLEADLGLHTYRLGLNKFADMTTEEVAARYTGFRAGQKTGVSSTFKATGKALPDSVDWRKEGYVTPVKDQGQCGSCWAFSSTGSMEGQNFKKTGKLLSFSEQQLVDCSGQEGNMGCGGGWMDAAFQSVIRLGGIETEKDYPYAAVDQQCKFNSNAVAARVTGHTDIEKTEAALQEAVATVGPISIAIDATGFFSYSGGIYNDPNCQQNAPDHAILIVGYGSENGQDFWIVKNSWAATWGEQGYIRMARNANNLCGIANYATYPHVA